jgi:hypothetical protein
LSQSVSPVQMNPTPYYVMRTSPYVYQGRVISFARVYGGIVSSAEE